MPDEFDMLDRGFRVTRTNKPKRSASDIAKAKRRNTSGGRSRVSKKPSSVQFSKNAKRNNINAVINKAPEVVVKIPKKGFNKGLKTFKNHLDYITRNGEIELTDHLGNKYKGKNDLKGIQEILKAAQIPQEGKKKEFIHVVFSMPANTPANAFQKAVNEFAKEEFGNRQYYMAFHDDTDHTHMHLAVGTRDIENVNAPRLSPDKEDLYRWRQGFADKLRENGIEAAASERKHRFNTRKKENGIIRNISGSTTKVINKDTGEVTEAKRQPTVYAALNLEIKAAVEAKIRPDNPALEKQEENNTTTKENWLNVAKRLDSEGDKVLADKVREFVKLADEPIITRNQELYDKAIEAEQSKNIDKDKDMEHEI